MYFSARRRNGAATYRHDNLVVAQKPATATTMISMGVRGSTGNGGLYAIGSLAMWSVTPLPPIADDILRGQS